MGSSVEIRHRVVGKDRLKVRTMSWLSVYHDHALWYVPYGLWVDLIPTTTLQRRDSDSTEEEPESQRGWTESATSHTSTGARQDRSSGLLCLISKPVFCSLFPIPPKPRWWHPAAGSSRASPWTSLSLNCLLCEIGIIIPMSLGCSEDQRIEYVECGQSWHTIIIISWQCWDLKLSCLTVPLVPSLYPLHPIPASLYYNIIRGITEDKICSSSPQG